MDALEACNAQRRREIEALRDQLDTAQAAQLPPPFASYPLPQLKARIHTALVAGRPEGAAAALDIQFDLIEREKFGGDLVLKFPGLLAKGGPKAFISQHQPWIVGILSGPELADAIARVELRGMYINLTLSDRWLLDSAQAVVDRGAWFGHCDTQAQRRLVLDYSSPNVAKVLHAGHIRSTIIGHVLGNLHAACGGQVYRVNHINDFGGFGFLLEGYRRFAAGFPQDLSDSDRLLEIYRIRRTLERHVAAASAPATWPDEDRALLARYFPGTTSADAVQQAWRAYVDASDIRFAALESGDAGEVALWQDMVAWSLREFDRFYEALRIHIDFVIGESFYAAAGAQVVAQALAAGTAQHYTQTLADQDLARVDARHAAAELTDAEQRTAREAIAKDVGAVVVRVGDQERYVIQRADGASIYATRDLGAIQLRQAIFAPHAVTYVVGQEQQTHFARLFKAAAVLGLIDPAQTTLQHLHFGFYVDAATGRKLSSRDSVSSVNRLLAMAVDHFRSRCEERASMEPAELDEAASQLAVGSLVFNDLKQDIRGAVEIDAASPERTIAGFEKSGGAYLVYSACRARSILRRHGAEPIPARQIQDFAIDAQEAGLLIQLQRLAEIIAEAAAQSNPTLLVRQLLDIAARYNAWYMRAPVLGEDGANPARLLITQAVERALVSALRICHIECPPKI